MGESCELSIVLPAYREADSLRQLLPKLTQAAAALTPDFEIVVVDSLTPLDDTQAVCEAAGVHHLFRRGGNKYGDAVRTGIAESRGRFVLLMDADGSHNPADIERLFRERGRHDVIIGSRYISGGKTENPATLIFLSFVVNWTYRLAFGLRVRDVSNSFRLYRGDQLRALHLDSDDFEIVQEILIRLASGTSRASVTEVPVKFEKRKAGESKRNLLAFSISYLRSILRLRRFRARAIAEARGAAT